VPRRVLAVLVLLAAAAVLRGVAWAAALPAWQGPDEHAHYAYVERLADGELPPAQRGAHELSAAVRASLEATAWERFRTRDPARPLTARQLRALPPEPPGLSTDGVGAVGATPYPPLYYALAVPAYALPGLHTATARLFAVRTVSALLAALLVVATFLLVREVTGRSALALAGAALASLPPMVGQASGTANPDVLLTACAAGLAWSLVRLRRDPARRSRWLHAVAWGVATLLTKPPAPAVAVALVLGLLLVPAAVASRRLAVAVTAAASGIGAAVAAAALLAHERRENLAVAAHAVLDYYDPTSERTARGWIVWVESGVGGFGWQSVWLPSSAYWLAVVVVAGGAAAAAVGLARDRTRAHARFAAGVAGALLAYVAALHAFEATELVRGREHVLQGRYLLPLVPVAVAGFLAGCATLPARARATVVGAALAVWGLLGVLGLAATAEYFGA